MLQFINELMLYFFQSVDGKNNLSFELSCKYSVYICESPNEERCTPLLEQSQSCSTCQCFLITFLISDPVWENSVEKQA